MGIVHINSGTTGKLLHLRSNLGVGLGGLCPTITFTGAHRTLLFAQFLLREVFRRVLVALDHRNDSVLIVSLPSAVIGPFTAIHHHNGKLETAVFAIQLGYIGRQGLLRLEGGRGGT